MNKHLKKLLCAVLSLGMAAGSIVLPTAASAEGAAWSQDAENWKFDFGSAENVADGYIGVSADKDYLARSDYGFLGLGDNGYKASSRTDSFEMKKGQKITLQNGGKETVTTANDDCVGVTAAAEPIRFAMKAANNTDYKVKAVLTGADMTKEANVSLYSEKRHPIVTEQTIAAGETLEVEFTATIQNVYYEKSDPKETYKDDQLNVVVLGENAAIASLEVTKVENAVTLWAYTDSTGCDQNAAFPYFKLQDCSGVAQSLSKYLSKDIAVSNQGEGGLTAADNNHWNCANANIQAGDYVYVQFGHNHKSDGPTGYAAAIKKYYEKAHSVGAYTIFVSPCDRHNETNGKKPSESGYQKYYDDTTNTWTSTLSGFGDAAKAYVDELIAGGATDVAYIDLNTPSLRWMESVCADVKTKRGADKYEANATDYYFQGTFGGGVDGTHPNDAGSDNLAYCVMQEAKKTVDADPTSVQAKVLSGLVADMRTATPYVVTEDIVKAGKAPNSKYPVPYVTPNLPNLPVVINDIKIENGAVVSVDVTKRDATQIMDSYGIIVITVYDETGAEKGKIYAKDQVEKSAGNGTQTITNFTNDVTIGDTDKYKAIVMKAKDTADGIIVDEEANLAYSAVYELTDITDHLITDEDGNGTEDFEFYGAVYEGDTPTDLSGKNDWNVWGSAGKTTTLGQDGDKYYANMINDGAKNGAAAQGSFYAIKAFESAPAVKTTGRYMFEADLQYISGGGLNVGFVDGATDKTPWATQAVNLFVIGNSGKITVGNTDTEAGALNQGTWAKVKAVLDMDRGKLSVSVDGGAEVAVDLDNYNTTSLNVTPTKLSQLSFNSNKVAVGIKAANITVAKLKNETLPSYTAQTAASSDTMGSVSITEGTDADFDASLSYEGDKAVVTASKALSGQLIEVKYNNGVLSEVIPTPVELTETELTKQIPVTAGSKLMLWDSLSGMTPLARSITAATADDKSVTAPLNTILTAKAEANEGYVFMGWSDGKNIVSEDTSYTFRLRDDITLTAQFVKEPKITDVKDYTLVADKSSVKAVAGTTVNVSIQDAKDADGTPVSIVTNEDATWLCEEKGITVANGVVTIGEDFSMDDAETKTVVVKSKLNEIEKSCSIVVNIYDYYEDFSGDLEKANWFTNLGDGSASIVNGALTTKGASGKNNTYTGMHFAAPSDVVNKLITIKYDYKTSSVSSGNNTSHIFLANLALTENAPTYSAPGTNFQIAADSLALSANIQYSVTVTINNKTKTAEISAQPETGDSVTLSIADTKDTINTLFFRPGKNVTDTIDNVRVTMVDAE